MRMVKKIWAIVAPFVIILLGLIGFVWGEGLGFYDALLNSLKLPKGYLDPLPFNIALELARWLGIAYILSMFYAAIIALINSGAVFIRSSREDTVAVHGDSVYANMLASGLGKRALQTDSKRAFKAPTQVIFFSNDKETLEFYQRHSELFKTAKKVHLCLNDTHRSASVIDNVYVINISESKAIYYWQKNYIHEHKKIVLIGSGDLAEKILSWGLQMNVFDPGKNVDYLIYGDFNKFNKLHPQIVNNMLEYGGDRISFGSDWFEHVEEIKGADRIILCGKTNENIEIATLMSEAGIDTEIHVFIEGASARTIFDASNIHFVGDLSPQDAKDLILMDKIHEGGKVCNVAYDLYEHAQSTDEDLTFETVRRKMQDKSATESWAKLDSFTKGSNYSSAMHDIQKYGLLKKAGLDVSGLTVRENEQEYNELSQDVKDFLQEIEHIRWARYHFLHNWKHPEEPIIMDGIEKKKDSQKRLHVDLVPYCDLSKEDQEKDSYFYKTLSLRFKSH